jgi:hypothetical protein
MDSVRAFEPVAIGLGMSFIMHISSWRIKVQQSESLAKRPLMPTQLVTPGGANEQQRTSVRAAS